MDWWIIKNIEILKIISLHSSKFVLQSDKKISINPIIPQILSCIPRRLLKILDGVKKRLPLSVITRAELEEWSKQRCNDQQTFIRIPDTISPSSAFLYRNKQFIIPRSWNSFLRIHCAAIGSILKYSGQLAYQGGLNPPTSVWILRTEEARGERILEKRRVCNRGGVFIADRFWPRSRRGAHTRTGSCMKSCGSVESKREGPLSVSVPCPPLSIPYAPVFSVSIVAWSGDTKPGERDRGRAP